jgi:hypothetical protein
VSVVFTDPFTKEFKVTNVTNNTDNNLYKIYYDISDDFGNIITSKSAYSFGQSAWFSLVVGNSYYASGTYTIRVFGDNIAPSYK